MLFDPTRHQPRGIKHDICKSVIIGDWHIGPIWNQVNFLTHSKSILGDSHRKPKRLDRPIFEVLYLHQVVIELTVNCLDVVDLVALINDLVEEESS